MGTLTEEGGRKKWGGDTGGWKSRKRRHQESIAA